MTKNLENCGIFLGYDGYMKGYCTTNWSDCRVFLIDMCPILWPNHYGMMIPNGVWRAQRLAGCHPRNWLSFLGFVIVGPDISPDFMDNIYEHILVGGLEHGFYDFPFSWECHHPNWRTPWFFRGVGLNHQPDILYISPKKNDVINLDGF